MTIKVSSRKQKGRVLQQWMIKTLVDLLKIDPEDIENRSMGAGGEDIIMSKAAREKFPFSVECKNQQKVNVWSAYQQACENAKQYQPIVVIKRNHTKPLIVIDAEAFIKLFIKE